MCVGQPQLLHSQCHMTGLVVQPLQHSVAETAPSRLSQATTSARSTYSHTYYTHTTHILHTYIHTNLSSKHYHSLIAPDNNLAGQAQPRSNNLFTAGGKKNTAGHQPAIRVQFQWLLIIRDASNKKIPTRPSSPSRVGMIPAPA